MQHRFAGNEFSLFFTFLKKKSGFFHLYFWKIFLLSIEFWVFKLYFIQYFFKKSLHCLIFCKVLKTVLLKFFTAMSVIYLFFHVFKVFIYSFILDNFSINLPTWLFLMFSLHENFWVPLTHNFIYFVNFGKPGHYLFKYFLYCIVSLLLLHPTTQTYTIYYCLRNLWNYAFCFSHSLFLFSF